MTKQDTATYREVIDISRRLEDKIDKMSITLAEKYVTKEDLISIRKDVSDLKNWRYYLTGIAAAVGAIIALFINNLKIKI